MLLRDPLSGVSFPPPPFLIPEESVRDGTYIPTDAFYGGDPVIFRLSCPSGSRRIEKEKKKLDMPAKGCGEASAAAAAAVCIRDAERCMRETLICCDG